MYIVTVIPISNIPRQNTLTYFSKEEVSLGSMVSAPYNKVSIKALVIQTDHVSTMKSAIKQEFFQLKKITKILGVSPLSPEFIKDCILFGEKYFIKPSLILYDIFPQWYWDFCIGKQKTKITKKIDRKKEIILEYNISTTSDSLEQIYKNTYIQNNIIWIIIPDLQKQLSYIKKQTHSWQEVYFLHSAVTSSKQQRIIEIVENRKTPHAPLYILSTAHYSGLALLYTDTLVFQHTTHDGYFLHPPYFYDAKELPHFIKSNTLQKIIKTDSKPIITKDGILGKIFKTEKLFQYKVYTKIKEKRHNELFIHEALETEFLNDIQNDKKILIVCYHKDQKQKVLCHDCQDTYACQTCAHDLYLMTKKNETYFSCSFCKKTYSTKVTCTICKSWNMQALGLYKENIQTFLTTRYSLNTEELKKITFKTLVEIINTLDTEQSYDAAYVLSIDTYLNQNNFLQEEKIYTILKKLSQLALKVSLQTSFPTPNILTTFKEQTYSKWANQEILKRKQFNFPPFGIEYKISAINTKGLLYLNKLEDLFLKKEIKYVRSIKTYIYIYAPTDEEKRYDMFLLKIQNKDIILGKKI